MSEKKFIKSLVILTIIGLLFIGYGRWLSKTVRQETIESAVLVELTGNNYTISFDGELHEYRR